MSEQLEQLRAKLEAEKVRHREAVHRILAVSAELQLTWKELDDVIESIKHKAYVLSRPDQSLNLTERHG